MRLVLGLVAAALVLGCSAEDDGLVRTPEDLEQFLIAEVGRTSGELPVGNVDCPEELPKRDGATVECDVELGGVGVRYTVRRLVGGRVQMQPSQPIVDIDGSEAAVVTNLGDGYKVDCGPEKVAQKDVGGRIPCTVTAPDGGTRKIDLVVEDASGKVKAVDA